MLPPAALTVAPSPLSAVPSMHFHKVHTVSTIAAARGSPHCAPSPLSAGVAHPSPGSPPSPALEKYTVLPATSPSLTPMATGSPQLIFRQATERRARSMHDIPPSNPHPRWSTSVPRRRSHSRASASPPVRATHPHTTVCGGARKVRLSPCISHARHASTSSFHTGVADSSPVDVGKTAGR
eukprot:gene11158-54375_t